MSAAAEDEEDPLPIDPGSPEVQRLSARCGADFRAAVQKAFATLPPRDRKLLRMRCVERRTLDEVAAIFSVHRLTVFRWLTQVEELVLSQTRQLLGEGQELSKEALERLQQFGRRELQFSLSTLADSAPR